MKSGHELSVASMACAAALSFLGLCCSGPQGVGLLPPPPEGAVPAASYQPANPFKEVSPNAHGRSLFAARADGLDVEVRDVLVPPRQSAPAVPLGGAAMLEVLTGTAVVDVAGELRQLAAGASIAVPQQDTLTVRNNGDEPATLRLYVVKIP